MRLSLDDAAAAPGEEVEVRATTVTLRPPHRHDRKLPTVTVNVVLVEETNPPDGVTPIQWLLVTTLPIDDPEQVPVERLGPLIEHCDAFPERVNVEFVAVRGRAELVQRTWERGTGETLACGSGACASAVAAVLTGRCERELTIHLRGGDLEIRWPDPGGPVWLTGLAAHVFDGEIEIP